VWFEEPEFFFDHDSMLVGPPGKMGRFDVALYSSITVVNGKTVLWYPDRKFFLLGKIISDKK
ncbi:MAG: BNR/Asp-box repeat protein, partial [Verrucomicrobiales bacterium]|nr:BNR/Asp-box repeat protein [Verrucomicrobiales bacterium]